MILRVTFVLVLLGTARAQRFGPSRSFGGQSIRLSPGPGSFGTSFGSSSSSFLSTGGPSQRSVVLRDQRFGSRPDTVLPSSPLDSRTVILRGSSSQFGSPTSQFQAPQQTHVISSVPQSVPQHQQTIVATQPQQTVVSQPQTVHVQQAPQPVQTVLHQPAAVTSHTSTGNVHLTSAHAPAPAPQQPALAPAAHPMSPMGMSPMGMSPMNPMMAMGGMMNPMSAMMGMGPHMMQPNPFMSMGMPFMPYDTMEDLFLDPDRPDPVRMRGPGMAAASAAMSRSAAGFAAGAPASGFTSAAAAIPGTATGTAAAVQPAGGATAGVDPSLVQSALQTALSRVQQRTAGTSATQVVG